MSLRKTLIFVFSLICVIVGCIWNSFELERVVLHPSGLGKNFGYGLTLTQCLFISIVAFFHLIFLRWLFPLTKRIWRICWRIIAFFRQSSMNQQQQQQNQNHHRNYRKQQQKQNFHLSFLEFIFADEENFSSSSSSSNALLFDGPSPTRRLPTESLSLSRTFSISPERLFAEDNNNNNINSRESSVTTTTTTTTRTMQKKDEEIHSFLKKEVLVKNRPLLTMQPKLTLTSSFLFWLSNLINNIVFKFGIAVPIQQVIRSASLLSSALCNYLFFGKRFSLTQISLLLTITIGIAWLSIASVTTTTSSATNSCCDINPQNCGNNNCSNTTTTTTKPKSKVATLFPDVHDATATFYWLVGVGILCISAFLGTLLGIVQGEVFKESQRRLPGSNDWTGVTEEAIFVCHFFSSLFFIFTRALSQTENPQTHLLTTTAKLSENSAEANSNYFFSSFLFEIFINSNCALRELYQELFLEFPSDLVRHVVMNSVSQYICIWGVFTLSSTSTSFFVSMATTIRKFLSLVLSITYFGHVNEMKIEQIISISMVTIAVSVYPFVPSASSSSSNNNNSIVSASSSATSSKLKSVSEKSLTTTTTKKKRARSKF